MSKIKICRVGTLLVPTLFTMMNRVGTKTCPPYDLFDYKFTLAFILYLLLIPGAEAAASTSPGEIPQGEMIYRQGVLPTGQPLRGKRDADINVEGADAACVSCHRRSGLGSQEGRYIIPPIIGKYLFRPGLRNIEDLTTPHVEGYRPNRSAYTEETLARAIRDGIDADGRELNYLMPRFKLVRSLR